MVRPVCGRAAATLSIFTTRADPAGTAVVVVGSGAADRPEQDETSSSTAAAGTSQIRAMPPSNAIRARHGRADHTIRSPVVAAATAVETAAEAPAVVVPAEAAAVVVVSGVAAEDAVVVMVAGGVLNAGHEVAVVDVRPAPATTGRRRDAGDERVMPTRMSRLNAMTSPPAVASAVSP
ncbi:hypothetical protein GCM10018954_086660 [Kutzneria kofuensis]